MVRTQRRPAWRADLHRLKPLNMPLVPCGAGPEKKAPIDPDTGRGLNKWQTASFTVEQIAVMPPCVRSVGARTGNGVICFDIDGPTAVELAIQQGCNPELADTFQVHRDTDTDRLKLLYSVTSEQEALLGNDCAPKAHTKPPIKDENGKLVKKGEAVEVFHHPGRQVILLGDHVISNGNYFWPEDQGPEALQPIPPEWLAMALKIKAGKLGIDLAPPSSKATSKGEWRNLKPCPICGREDGWCQQHRNEGTILCAHGSTFNPEHRHGILRKGQTITGDDGIAYGYCGKATHTDGNEFSTFVVHKPRPEASLKPNSSPSKADPTPAAVIDITEARKRLREALDAGTGHADLQQLQAELAQDLEMSPISVQRLADAEQHELEAAEAIKAEALVLEAEADRRDIGQALTLHYLLPASIADAITTRTRSLPIDGPSAALPFITTVAGLVKLGTEVEALRSAGYTVPLNLYGCLVGRSGAKKSPVGSLLVDKPIHQLCCDAATANRRALEQWQEDNRGIKRDERTTPPFPKRVYISDSTGEALAAQLEAHEQAGLGLLIYRDELSGLFGSFNQYRKGSGSDEQQLLEAYDGRGLTSVRIVSSRYYSSCQLSIWGTTQPAVLRELVANGDASGLWARFLFVPLPERVVPLPTHETEEQIAAAAHAEKVLAAVCDTVFRMPRRRYRLSEAAKVTFATYEANHQREALKATIGAVSALYGKSSGKVLRVAGLLHLLQVAVGDTTSDVIEADTINRAAALVDHLDGWALSLHSEVATGGVGDLMRTVHRLAEAAGGAIRWKEVLVKLSSKARKENDSVAFAEAAKALAAAGYGVVEAGRRGAISYRATNPLP